MKDTRTEAKSPQPTTGSVQPVCSVRLHLELSAEESAWLRTLHTSCWSRQVFDAAHAGFIEGWYRRTGENSNAQNAALSHADET